MNSINKLITGSVCVTAFLFTVAHVSAANLIVNPGFESGLANWTFVGMGPSAYGSAGGPNGPSAPGVSSAIMTNYDLSATLSLQQTTSPGGVVPGTLNYSFDVQDYTQNGASFSFHILSVPTSGPATDLGPGTEPSYNDFVWHTISGSVTAPSNVDHLLIEFDCTTSVTANSGEVLSIDNVSITQVPEPTTVTLVAMGLLSAIAFGRKRKS